MFWCQLLLPLQKEGKQITLKELSKVGTQILVIVKLSYYAHLQLNFEAYISVSLCLITINNKPTNLETLSLSMINIIGIDQGSHTR